MKLNSGNLRSAKLLHIVDMMDMIIFNNAEYTSHTAHDAGLFAMVNMASADNMASDFFFQPSMILTAAHRIPLHLRRALHMLSRKVVVVLRVVIFSERNSRTLAVADFTVLDNPALRPVRPHHAVLIGRRRRPGGRRFIHAKSRQGNIAHARLGRHEAIPADINFHLLPIRVFSLKIRIDNRFVSVLFRIPFINGILPFPGRRPDFSGNTFFQRLRLI